MIYPEQKQCYICKVSFNRKRGVSLKTWEQIRCCSLSCSFKTRKEVSTKTRQKMRVAKLGKVLTKEHKAKIGLAHSGMKHPWMKGFFKGYKHSDASKKVMSEKRMGITLSKETRKKMSVSRSGELSHMWIKDRTKVLDNNFRRKCLLGKEWTLSVKTRDGWKCQISNKDCCNYLEAHHILPWKDYAELRYDVNNGITLCRNHHPRKRSEVERLSPYFQSIVNIKMAK